MDDQKLKSLQDYWELLWVPVASSYDRLDRDNPYWYIHGYLCGLKDTIRYIGYLNGFAGIEYWLMGYDDAKGDMNDQ